MQVVDLKPASKAAAAGTATKDDSDERQQGKAVQARAIQARKYKSRQMMVSNVTAFMTSSYLLCAGY